VVKGQKTKSTDNFAWWQELAVHILDVVSVELESLRYLLTCPFPIVEIDFAIDHQVSDLSAYPKSKLGAAPLGELNRYIWMNIQSATVNESSRALRSEGTVNERGGSTIGSVIFESLK